MKNRLEEFIVANRKSFDEEVPSVSVWENICTDLPQQKKKTKLLQLSTYKLWAAAVTVTVVGLAVYLWVENNRLQQDLTATEQRLQQQTDRSANTIANYDKEINQFTQLVAMKQNQLSKIRKEYPGLYQSFKSDINELHEEYKKLKQELPNVPEQDEILDAMIQNLQLQAELLNEQLLIIQQLKTNKRNKNEKATPLI